MPSSATPAVKNSDLKIEYRCPQCGAPAELTETDRLIRCGFCRVTAYLQEDDFLSFLIPAHAPAGRDLIYFPYWRFKGFEFTFGPQGMQQRVRDLSHQALVSPHFPVSLGLRTQALKLQFVDPAAAGYFIHPQVSIAEALAQAERLTREVHNPAFHFQTHVGETLSLIYAPYYADGALMDAVRNEPLAQPAPSEAIARLYAGGRPPAGLSFLAALCPACGWDLAGESDARVLTCTNCRTLWEPAAGGFKALEGAHQAAASASVYLPFWRIAARVEGLSLASYADLARAANLPRAVRPAWESMPFHFWTPAFRIRPGVFMRLARGLTLAPPAEPLVPGPPPAARLLTANLAFKAACSALTAIVVGFYKPAGKLPALLARLHITPAAYRLVWMPFAERHHDLVHPGLNLAINKTQLALAHNL
jgi:hypothetical protein